MKNLLIIAILVCLLSISSALATTYYVDTNNGSDSYQGDINNPFKTIGHAIDSASNDDTIIVLSGTYAENIGIDKSIKLLSEDPNDWHTVGNTIIQNSGNLIGIEENCTIRGFTITGGSTGIRCFQNDVNVVVTNCIITGNSGSDYGGGIELEASGVNFMIDKCYIYSNQSNYSGGGIAVWNMYSDTNNIDLTITNSVFWGNSSGDGGAAEINNYTIAHLRNCTFYDNQATHGGGIFDEKSHVDVNNCILWGNESTYSGPQIHNRYSSYSVNLSFSLIEGGFDAGSCYVACVDGGGNIDADPCFVDIDSNDLRLGLNSPCIDTGDSNLVNINDKDIDGKNRIIGTRVDMGAYEFGPIVHNTTQDIWYLTIQPALDNANPLDNIVAYPGTYYESINFGGVNCTLHSIDPNNWETVADTIIDGGYIDGPPSDTNAVVTFNNSEDANAVLQGFTIQHGYGGGVICIGASPTITNCIIKDHIPYSAITISSCSPKVENCFILDTRAAIQNGGGVNIIGNSSPEIYNTVFAGNESDYLGGAISLSADCSATITNCTIYNNSANYDGGGIYDPNSSSVITNCILWGNYNWGPTPCQVSNFTYSGSGVYTYCDIQGGLPGDFNGNDNINSDPCFIDASNNNFALLSISPCIDAGYNNVLSLMFDIEGKPRIVNGTVDMGAYEFAATHNITQDEYYPTIQGALDEADNLDVIEVYPGPYYENIDFNGVSCTLQSTNPNDWETTANTIIDGGYTGGIPSNTDPVVTFSNSEDANAFLHGFTIQHGYGGGIYCSGAQPNITNCIIKNNMPTSGINILACSPTVTNCFILDNLSAFQPGGGIYITGDSSPDINNVVLSGNESMSFGGGISLSSSGSPVVTNCTIYDNLADYGGGGIFDPNTSSTITNCIIWGNSPSQLDNFTYSSSGYYSYCDIQGGLPGDFNGGAGIITTTPDFINTSDLDGADDILGTIDDGLALDPNDLDPDSPCIDAGDNTATDSPIDITGNTRKVDDPYTDDTGNGTAPLVDIGAYEFDPSN